MQIRPKTYLHLISLWRSIRDAIPPHHDDVPAEASPSLIYAAVVLAFLLAFWKSTLIVANWNPLVFWGTTTRFRPLSWARKVFRSTEFSFQVKDRGSTSELHASRIA